MCPEKNNENTNFNVESTAFPGMTKTILGAVKCNIRLCNNSMLGVFLENILMFQSHVKQLCKKACQKLSALSKEASY